MADSAAALTRLQEVLDRLLGPGGCPWDQKQTPESLCEYVIEESFELVDAIRQGKTGEVAEEIGDVLFLLLFVARLYEKRGDFALPQAIEGAAGKMIRRHPHVFADLSFENQEELLRNWEAIKRREKAASGDADRPQGIFSSLPGGLPALQKAYRLHAKAARIGFTWESDAEAERQLASEWTEWLEARADADPARMEEEFGDYLFTLVEHGRRHGLKAAAALDKANIKFLARFERMEELARAQGQALPDLTLAEMNALWDEAKRDAG